MRRSWKLGYLEDLSFLIRHGRAPAITRPRPLTPHPASRARPLESGEERRRRPGDPVSHWVFLQSG